MLQVTEAAAGVFRDVIGSEGFEGNVIRIAPSSAADGRAGIVFQAVEEPLPGDTQTEAHDLNVFVAPELAPVLDEAVLDARDVEGGSELFLRPQE